MKRILFQAFLLAFSGFSLAGQGLANETTRPSAEVMQRLLAGEVVLQDANSSKSGGAGRAVVLVFGGAQAYWNVIVSCDLAFRFVDGLRACEVLEDHGDRALVRQVVKKHWLIPVQEFVFESIRRPYREISFQLLEGDLDVMNGGWRFTPVPEGVLVEYQARIKPSMPVPRFLVSRTIRKDTPDMMACIRGLASGSGSAEAETADLSRCPGQGAATQ